MNEIELTRWVDATEASIRSFEVAATGLTDPHRHPGWTWCVGEVMSPVEAVLATHELTRRLGFRVSVILGSRFKYVADTTSPR